MKAPRLRPHYAWADYDPCAPRSAGRWAYYRTKAEQRANRPDLPAVRVRVIPCLPARRG